MKRRYLCAIMAKTLVALIGAGCFTPAARQPRDAVHTAEVRDVLHQWRDAFVAGNLDGVMALYSEHFSARGKDRAAITRDLEEMMRDGHAHDVRVNVDIAAISGDDRRVSVRPIALCTQTGSDTLRLDLARETNGWRVVDMDSK